MILGAPPELKFLPIGRLSVDMAYQRSLESERSRRLIARIAEAFDWTLFGTVMVAPLPFETWELMDGQHRVAGARLAGIDKVPAAIIAAPTIEQRARIFRDANRQRVTVHPFSIYYADVKAGDPDAVSLAALCDLTDIEIPRYPLQQRHLKPNQCLSLVTLRKLALEYEHERKAALAASATGGGGGGGRPFVLDEIGPIKTLRILRAAFPDEPGGLRQHLILGLREWVRLHPACDAAAVATALQRYGLERLEKQVFSIGFGGARRAEAVLKVLGQAIPYAAGGKRRGEDDSARDAGLPRNSCAGSVPRGPMKTLPSVQKVGAAPRFDPRKLTARPGATVRVKGRE